MGPNDYDISPNHWWNIVTQQISSGQSAEIAIDIANRALAAYRLAYVPVTLDAIAVPVTPSN